MTVVTIGELVVDWLATTRGQSLLESGCFYRCLGGNASNVAIGLSRLGSAVRLIGKVGEDVDGLYLSKVLSEEVVDVSFVIKDPRYHTAQCYCLTNLDGEHRYYNWPNSNAAQMLFPDEISEKAFDGASFFHATGISLTQDPRRQAVKRALEIASQRGMILSFDAGFPTGEDVEARLSIEQVLSKTHILKLNFEELLFWSGGQSADRFETLAQKVFAAYEPIVLVVTLAEEGSLFVTSREQFKYPAFPVRSVDAVGAGDGFVAGLLHSLQESLGPDCGPEGLRSLSSQDWREAALLANAVGALVTTKVGAFEGLPRRADVDALIGQH